MREAFSWAAIVCAVIALGFLLDSGYSEKEKKKVQDDLAHYESFSVNGENFSCDDVEKIKIDTYSYSASDVTFYLINGDKISTSIGNITWHGKEN